MTRYPSGRATSWLDFAAVAAGVALTLRAAVEFFSDYDRQVWFLFAIAVSPLFSALWMQWRMTGRLRALADPARREQIAVTPISRGTYLFWALRDPMVALLSPLALVPAWISIELCSRSMFAASLSGTVWRLNGIAWAEGVARLNAVFSHGIYFILLGLITAALSVACVLRRLARRCGARRRHRWYAVRPGFLCITLLALAYGNPTFGYNLIGYRSWWFSRPVSNFGYVAPIDRLSAYGSDLVIAFGSLALLSLLTPLYLTAAWFMAGRRFGRVQTAANAHLSPRNGCCQSRRGSE